MNKKIIIIGGGLVGSLLAVHLKNRNFDVVVYEKNAAHAIKDTNNGRASVNLTLSCRGLRVLEKIGLGEAVRIISKPVYGRMKHRLDGSSSYEAYGSNQEALYSISRNHLNFIIRDHAQNNCHVPFHFDSECVDYDCSRVSFKNNVTSTTFSAEADIIFAADGAYSSARYQLLRKNHFNYTQKYMNYGYSELRVPRETNLSWANENNVLHFWPRKNHLMVGFPNHDGSFTLSLFFPYQGGPSYSTIKERKDLMGFLQEYYPNILFTGNNYEAEFFSKSINSLISVSCYPWVFNDRFALIGDAAHAIVPFYGQGVNAGFEDCDTLANYIDCYPDDWRTIFKLYQQARKPNTDLITDFALRHFYTLCDNSMGQESQIMCNTLSKYSEDDMKFIYKKISFTNMQYIDILKLVSENGLLIAN